MSELPRICSFWYGQLGYLERICISSFIEHGHPFALYTYGDVGPVPEGCVLRDASEILPRERMFFYKQKRTPAVFADLFRLHLMAREAGIWADCDVYCLKPFAGLPPYIFGVESVGHGGPRINNAVFLCPPESALLKAMLAIFEPGVVPPGLPRLRALEVAFWRAIGKPLPIESMQFGATGPFPLNHLVKTLGLQQFVQPKPVFYPLDYGRARILLEPNSELGRHVKPETLGVHLWHSALTARGSSALSAPKPGSFLAREIARLGITT